MAASDQAHVLVIDHVAPVTRLLEKRRQMFEVQEALDAQKEEYARREEAARRREEELRKKDLDLQTSLIHYNKTITSNEDKRQRALQRIQTEERQVTLRSSEIDDLNHRIQQEEVRQDEKLQAIAQVQQYYTFLHSVQVAHPDEFSEIKQIQERFSSLKRLNLELQRRSSELDEQLRTARKELEEARSREITERLAQTLTASDMTSRYETLMEGTELLSRREAEAAVGEHRRVSEFGVVMASAANLFGRASRSESGLRIRHFDLEATRRVAQTEAEATAAASGYTMDALAPFLRGTDATASSSSSSSEAAAGASSSDADAATAAASSSSTNESKSSSLSTTAGGSKMAASSSPSRRIGVAGAGGKQKVAVLVEAKKATSMAGLRLEAVGNWVTDFESIVSAWKRDGSTVLADERRRLAHEADVAARSAAAAAGGAARVGGGGGSVGIAGRSSRLGATTANSVAGKISESGSVRFGRTSVRSGAGTLDPSRTTGIGSTAATGRKTAGRGAGTGGGDVWYVRTQQSATSQFGSFRGDSASHSVMS